MCEGFTCSLALAAFPIFILSFVVCAWLFTPTLENDPEHLAAFVIVYCEALAVTCLVILCKVQDNKRKEMEARVDRIKAERGHR